MPPEVTDRKPGEYRSPVRQASFEKLRLFAVCFALRVPRRELYSADESGDRQENSDPRRQIAPIQQNEIGYHEHGEGQRPHPRNDVIRANELRTCPELRGDLRAYCKVNGLPIAIVTRTMISNPVSTQSRTPKIDRTR